MRLTRELMEIFLEEYAQSQGWRFPIFDRHGNLYHHPNPSSITVSEDRIQEIVEKCMSEVSNCEVRVILSNESSDNDVKQQKHSKCSSNNRGDMEVAGSAASCVVPTTH